MEGDAAQILRSSPVASTDSHNRGIKLTTTKAGERKARSSYGRMSLNSFGPGSPEQPKSTIHRATGRRGSNTGLLNSPRSEHGQQMAAMLNDKTALVEHFQTTHMLQETANAKRESHSRKGTSPSPNVRHRTIHLKEGGGKIPGMVRGGGG